jgi:hypothetical protein
MPPSCSASEWTDKPSPAGGGAAAAVRSVLARPHGHPGGGNIPKERDMNSIRLRTAAAVLAVAAVGGTIVATTAASAAPASGAKTISFTEHTISDKTFNLGSGHGIAIGFVELTADKLMQGGKQVGRDGLSCTVTRLSGHSIDELCSAVEVLAGGQIDLSGLVRSTPSGPGTFDLAVTGGTGRYSNARGYATVVPANTPKVTIHLSQ